MTEIRNSKLVDDGKLNERFFEKFETVFDLIFNGFFNGFNNWGMFLFGNLHMLMEMFVKNLNM